MEHISCMSFLGWGGVETDYTAFHQFILVSHLVRLTIFQKHLKSLMSSLKSLFHPTCLGFFLIFAQQYYFLNTHHPLILLFHKFDIITYQNPSLKVLPKHYLKLKLLIIACGVDLSILYRTIISSLRSLPHKNKDSGSFIFKSPLCNF